MLSTLIFPSKKNQHWYDEATNVSTDWTPTILHLQTGTPNNAEVFSVLFFCEKKTVMNTSQLTTYCQNRRVASTASLRSVFRFKIWSLTVDYSLYQSQCYTSSAAIDDERHIKLNKRKSLTFRIKIAASLSKTSLYSLHVSDWKNRACQIEDPVFSPKLQCCTCTACVQTYLDTVWTANGTCAVARGNEF
jgi:hypothetical protein